MSWKGAGSTAEAGNGAGVMISSRHAWTHTTLAHEVAQAWPVKLPPYRPPHVYCEMVKEELDESDSQTVNSSGMHPCMVEDSTLQIKYIQHPYCVYCLYELSL